MYYFITFLARVSLKLYKLFTHIVQIIPETGNDFHISLELTVKSCIHRQCIYCMIVEYIIKILFKLNLHHYHILPSATNVQPIFNG